MLFDLKYDPSVIEIPVPRYFKDTADNLELEVVFVEEVDRGGKKKKKKAGGKKKKKKKGAEDEEKEVKMTLSLQEGFVNTAYKEALGYPKPDVVHESVYDTFSIDMDIDYAIRIIQSNERGRQGIARIEKIRGIIKKNQRDKIAREKAKAAGTKPGVVD